MNNKQKTRYLKKIVAYNMAMSTIVCLAILAICWRTGEMSAGVAGAVITPWAIENIVTMLIKKHDKDADTTIKKSINDMEDTSI